MVMTPGRVVLTYQDYAALPDDGRRYEIHEGELSVTPAPNLRHQEVVGNFFAALRAHVAARGLGKVYVSPVDVILEDTTIVQPDVVFLANDRLGLRSERGIEGPPTLAIEVLSTSTSERDRHIKMQLYARHGVPWYWIVDPDSRVVEAYGLVGDRYVLRTRAAGDEPLSAEPFPDLALPPASLWA